MRLASLSSLLFTAVGAGAGIARAEAVRPVGEEPLGLTDLIRIVPFEGRRPN